MINNLIPNPDTIQVSWIYFQMLLLLTTPIHFLFMNAMFGSAGIATYLHFKGGEKEKKLAHRIAVFLPLVIAFAVNFGVAPLLFAQVLYGQFLYTSSVLMAVFWISIIAILIVGYYLAYYYDFSFEKLGNAGKWVILIAFLLFIVIAYFFTNNMLLMTLPEKFSDWFNNMGGTILASSDKVFLPKYLHDLFGAMAIGGLYVALISQLKRDKDPELAEYGKELGLKVFFWFTIINILFGLWQLLVIPSNIRTGFLGGNGIHSVIFVLALLFIILALVFAWKKNLKMTATFGILTVFFMSFVRDIVRRGYLSPYFKPSDLKVVNEYSPFIFFLIVFVIGFFVAYWMIKKAIEAFN